MASSIGYIKKRVYREEYEAGKKLPKGWEVANDLGFYTSISTSQVEGERSKTQIEFSASKLDDLLEVVRAEHQAAVEAPLQKKLKARLKKSKEKDASIAQLHLEIEKLKKQHSSELKNSKKKLSESQAATQMAIEERDKAWDDNVYLDQELKRAQEERDNAISEYYEGGHAYETMKARLIEANELLIKHDLLREDSPGIKPSWNGKDEKPRPYRPYSGGSYSNK